MIASSKMGMSSVPRARKPKDIKDRKDRKVPVTFYPREEKNTVNEKSEHIEEI